MGGKYTEAQKKATEKYLKENTDQIQIRLPKGMKEVWKEAADKENKPLRRFIIDAVESAIQSDK